MKMTFVFYNSMINNSLTSIILDMKKLSGKTVYMQKFQATVDINVQMQTDFFFFHV